MVLVVVCLEVSLRLFLLERYFFVCVGLLVALVFVVLLVWLDYFWDLRGLVDCG